MSKRIFKVKAILFDMDGVITNTMPYHFRCWRKTLLNYGISVTKADIYQREGEKGFKSVKAIFQKYGKPYSDQLATKILAEKENLFKSVVRQKFVPGSRSFLRQLHQRGFKVALVTGSARDELHKMLPDHICDLFTVTLTGSDVKKGKPHPEPFLKCLKKLKVKAVDAVVIENAPFGLRSAKAAGLRCLILETSLPKEYFRNADGVFASYNELNQNIKFEPKK